MYGADEAAMLATGSQAMIARMKLQTNRDHDVSAMFRDVFWDDVRRWD
jgi:hypothetical protein